MLANGLNKIHFPNSVISLSCIRLYQSGTREKIEGRIEDVEHLFSCCSCDTISSTFPSQQHFTLSPGTSPLLWLLVSASNIFWHFLNQPPLYRVSGTGSRKTESLPYKFGPQLHEAPPTSFCIVGTLDYFVGLALIATL